MPAHDGRGATDRVQDSGRTAAPRAAKPPHMPARAHKPPASDAGNEANDPCRLQSDQGVHAGGEAAMQMAVVRVFVGACRALARMGWAVLQALRRGRPTDLNATASGTWGGEAARAKGVQGLVRGRGLGRRKDCRYDPGQDLTHHRERNGHAREALLNKDRAHVRLAPIVPA